MELSIVGRQLLVVVIVTTFNMMGALIAGAAVLGLTTVVNQIFLVNSLAMILTTLVLRQLTAQVGHKQQPVHVVQHLCFIRH